MTGTTKRGEANLSVREGGGEGGRTTPTPEAGLTKGHGRGFGQGVVAVDDEENSGSRICADVRNEGT